MEKGEGKCRRRNSVCLDEHYNVHSSHESTKARKRIYDETNFTGRKNNVHPTNVK